MEQVGFNSGVGEDRERTVPIKGAGNAISDVDGVLEGLGP